jgi:hypothetical protein
MAKKARVGFAAQLAATPGLAEAFQVEHKIIASIRENAQRWDLSPTQIALVLKIAEDVKNRPVEVYAAAPTGRVTFTGKVVSAKVHTGNFGDSYKMTVKVETPEGVWLAWGTVPSALLDSVPTGLQGKLANLKGATVEVTATLKAGNDPHFVFATRPSGHVVTQAPGTEEAAAVDAVCKGERAAPYVAPTVAEMNAAVEPARQAFARGSLSDLAAKFEERRAE